MVGSCCTGSVEKVERRQLAGPSLGDLVGPALVLTVPRLVETTLRYADYAPRTRNAELLQAIGEPR